MGPLRADELAVSEEAPLRLLSFGMSRLVIDVLVSVA